MNDDHFVDGLLKLVCEKLAHRQLSCRLHDQRWSGAVISWSRPVARFGRFGQFRFRADRQSVGWRQLGSDWQCGTATTEKSRR